MPTARSGAMVGLARHPNSSRLEDHRCRTVARRQLTAPGAETAMADPLVSVVVATFHREQMVVEAVRSALAQPGVLVEVLVMDDSADGSARAPIGAIGDPRVHYA